MGEVVMHGMQLANPLNRRRHVTVELPEFLVRAIDARVNEATVNPPFDEEVSFNDVVEWLLVAEITARQTAILESTIPGFTAAMATWLLNATYASPDDEQ